VDNNINDFDKNITAIAVNILTPTTTSGNFFYDDYGIKHFMTLNGPILIETAKNIVTSINNNAFIHSLTSSTEHSIVRCGNKVNIENLTVNIDFLDYYFDDNG